MDVKWSDPASVHLKDYHAAINEITLLRAQLADLKRAEMDRAALIEVLGGVVAFLDNAAIGTTGELWHKSMMQSEAHAALSGSPM